MYKTIHVNGLFISSVTSSIFRKFVCVRARASTWTVNIHSQYTKRLSKILFLFCLNRNGNSTTWKYSIAYRLPRWKICFCLCVFVNHLTHAVSISVAHIYCRISRIVKCRNYFFLSSIFLPFSKTLFNRRYGYNVAFFTALCENVTLPFAYSSTSHICID